MLQLLTRIGMRGRAFKARSADRDGATDRERISRIVAAIDHVLQSTEQEQAGLARRVQEVLARASVSLGNSSDEYLERDALDRHHQDLFGIEIANGQRRLLELDHMLAHLRFLKSATLREVQDRDTPSTDNN